MGKIKCKYCGSHYDPERKEFRKKLVRMQKTGASYQEIAETLNLNNVPAPRGDSWSKQSVYYIINN